MESSSCDGKRELETLDLQSGGSSLVVVGAHVKSTAFRSCHRLLLHPPAYELDLFPADGGTKPAPHPPAPSAGVQTVCTIEQVKRALERAAREPRRGGRPPLGRRGGRPPLGRRRLREVEDQAGSCSAASPSSSSSSSSSSVTTGSNKRPSDAGNGGAMVAAGCSGCLSYVLISTDNHRCPRCGSQVTPPPPVLKTKRPRIDLNFEFSN